MKLQWSDIISETLSPDEYLEKFNYKPLITKNFDNYIPIPNVLEDIKKILKVKEQKLKILTIGAEWCKDCSENTPKMIKLVKKLNFDIEFRILLGVKTNPLRKKGGLYWHPKHSPPEATDLKFDLQKIPIFYFFNKDGKYLARIVEHPTKGSTLEEDMLKIVEKKL